MSNTPRKIKITDGSDPADDISFDAIRATENEDDDDTYERDREPINLDTPVGLADAVAAAEAVRLPDEEEAVEAEEPRVVAPAAPAVDPEEITRMKAEVAAANNNYLRAIADLQNFRRRGEEEKVRITRDANERLIKELLPVLDDFDLAVDAARKAESFEQLIGGVDAILRKFRDTLVKQGVVAIEAVGTKFDPDLHEAVMLDDTTDQEDETVTAELRKGYTLHDRVIRPTLVKVAQRS